MATKEQVKKIYSLGAVCGLLDRSRGTEDELHLWVRQWAPRTEHISDLPEKQASYIISRLYDYNNGIRAAEPKGDDHSPGGITKSQQTFIFKLAELSPSNVPVRDRVCGVISNVLGTKVITEKDIFRDVTCEQGSEIIERIKRYIRTEKQKIKRAKSAQERGDENGNVKSGGATSSE